ncbi:hypothetical protein BX666DRAFT_2124335 [Dichotomocladium elegans]|nr:hypothetical protein BX666DRAFT_2124335 [Dichotomocladium elegans]
MPLPRQRPSQRVVLLFGVLLAGIILLVSSYFVWSPSSTGGKKKYKPSKGELADLVQYRDMDESIEEDTIRELFLPTSPVPNRHHSFDELQELVSTIDTALLPSVTIILSYNASIDKLESQLAKIHTQSIRPYSIWIVCETEDGKHFVERQKFPYSNVRILFRHDKTMPLPSTDYIWVLDIGVLPGRHYLEFLLKLGETAEYRNTLLGTGSTAQIRWRQDEVECRKGAKAQGTTAPAQILSGAWLLHRQWLLAAALDSRPDDVPLSYWISRNLGTGGKGIPLIALPKDSKKRSDYALRGVSDKNECTSLVNHFKNTRTLRLEDKLMVAGENASPQKTETMVFLVDRDTMESDWVRLACDMHSNTEDEDSAIHIATMADTIECPSFPSKRIHNMNTRPQWEGEVGVAEMAQQLIRLFRMIDTRVVVYLRDGGILHHAADIAKSIIGEKATLIGLPRESLPYIGWLTDLPLSALAQWHSILIKLIITTEGKDPKPFNRLYNSIQKSQLLDDRIDLMVFMESDLGVRAQRLTEHTVWEHGMKDIRHRIVPAERASMIVEAWYPATNDEYAIVLDDGMEISPLFYIWAKYTILKYRYAMPREDHLYGISLLTPRLLDTTEEARQLFMPPSVTSRAPFLMQTPPSLGGGAIYFPEHWREFHDYMNARVADSSGFRLQSVEIPDLKSRNWTHSWRRYMDELVYLRGNAMLYPNFGNGAGFATRNRLPIESKTNVTAFDISVLPFYTVPLINASFIDDLPDQRLPEFSKLQVLDLWGKTVPSLDALSTRGRDFQKNISACAPTEGYLFDPSDLLCPFARVVKVPASETNEPLPTKTIYLSAHRTV